MMWYKNKTNEKTTYKVGKEEAARKTYDWGLATAQGAESTLQASKEHLAPF